MFTTGQGEGYVAEKTELNKGWLFPVGDEAHDLGYPNMFSDMFNAIEEGRDAKETFYDGYVVNTILDAAYKSAKTKLWEPIILEDWRGNEDESAEVTKTSYDDTHYLVKKEVLPNGDLKIILKNKTTGKVSQIVK